MATGIFVAIAIADCANHRTIAMTHPFNLHLVRSAGSRATPPYAAEAKANAGRLAVLLRTALLEDGDVLYPLLGWILDAHMQGQHGDAVANGRIRDSLDEIQLLISMEIESAGLLQPPACPLSLQAESRSR